MDPAQVFNNENTSSPVPLESNTAESEPTAVTDEYLDWQTGNYDLPTASDQSSGSSSVSSALAEESSSSPSAGKKIKGYAKVAGKRALGQVISSGMSLVGGAYSTATKLPLAATLGTLGIAAGLASDNGANVAKYGATAAGIGYALNGSNNVNLSELKEDSLREIYGKDYEEYKNQQSDKAFMKDRESINYYKEKYGSEEYKQKMQTALRYRQNGITDNKLISKAMKAPGNFGDEHSEQRIALAKLASQVSNSKDVDSLSSRLKLKGVPAGKVDEVTDAVRYIKGLI